MSDFDALIDEILFSLEAFYGYASETTKQYQEARKALTDAISAAVSWFVEGATPLSPMERAMRKWPIRERKNEFNHQCFYLGDREVEKHSSESYYFNGVIADFTHYTESEAVAYLLEGYKPKLPEINITWDQKAAQAAMDEMWRAGYRPTKENK
jgi:hypothetical protein